MPAPPANRPPDNGNGSSPTPARYGIDDLLEDAEQLRGLLQDASARVTRMLGALKHQRRQSKALRSAMASL